MTKIIKSYFSQDGNRLDDIFKVYIPLSFRDNWKEVIMAVSEFLDNVQCNYSDDLVASFEDEDDKDFYKGIITKKLIEENKDYIEHCVDCLGSCLERTLEFIEVISSEWGHEVICLDETFDADFNKFD